MPEKLICVKLYMIIIRLPCEACVDQDHELQVHDIIRLPHEVRVDHDHKSQIYDIIKLPSEASVDHDHELQVHDIIKRRAGVIQISGVPALFIFLQLEYIQVIRDKKVSLIIFLSLSRVKLPAPCEIRIFCVV